MMNPRHYHERGWHCTSSIGTLGAAAAAARVLGLDAAATAHALGIAASSACGLKENIGTMVKPLHAGLAARNGVMAARLAKEGFTASEQAIDGPQGYLAAMDSERPASALAEALADLDSRWEILDTGVTVKLYPSCAATHPPLDVLLDLKRRHGFTADDVEAIDVEVDSMTPRLLIYAQPSSDLEAKFSMPFCAAAAVVFGHPTIDTFDLPSHSRSAGAGADDAGHDARESRVRCRGAAVAGARLRPPARWPHGRRSSRRRPRLPGPVERRGAGRRSSSAAPSGR